MGDVMFLPYLLNAVSQALDISTLDASMDGPPVATSYFSCYRGYEEHWCETFPGHTPSLSDRPANTLGDKLIWMYLLPDIVHDLTGRPQEDRTTKLYGCELLSVPTEHLP